MRTLPARRDDTAWTTLIRLELTSSGVRR
jgi:hypothetical protein